MLTENQITELIDDMKLFQSCSEDLPDEHVVEMYIAEDGIYTFVDCLDDIIPDTEVSEDLYFQYVEHIKTNIDAWWDRKK